MAKKVQEPTEAPKYEMPAVELGDIVLWHASHEEPPVCSAVVTEVNNATVAISLIQRNFYNMEPKDGVRHIDHPDKAGMLASECGCWSHKKSTVASTERLAELEAILMTGQTLGE